MRARGSSEGARVARACAAKRSRISPAAAVARAASVCVVCRCRMGVCNCQIGWCWRVVNGMHSLARFAFWFGHACGPSATSKLRAQLHRACQMIYKSCTFNSSRSTLTLHTRAPRTKKPLRLALGVVAAPEAGPSHNFPFERPSCPGRALERARHGALLLS